MFEEISVHIGVLSTGSPGDVWARRQAHGRGALAPAILGLPAMACWTHNVGQGRRSRAKWRGRFRSPHRRLS